MTRGALAVAFGLFVLSFGDAAASCVPLSPAEQEAQADAIVEGTVLSIATVGVQSEVTIGVDRVLKGAPDAVLALEASLPGELVAGEVPFHEGWKYWRLYLREITPGTGRFYTTLCDGTREIPTPQPAEPEPSPPTTQVPAPGHGCSSCRASSPWQLRRAR